MKIFKLLAILGVTIVVGKKMKNQQKGKDGDVIKDNEKKHKEYKHKHNEGCPGPQAKPIVNGTCEAFRDKGKCQKCHYGKHCCCDDKCTHDETFTCENGVWILTSGKCTSQCTICPPYGSDSKVCNTEGAIENKCHASHFGNYLFSVDKVDKNAREEVCREVANTAGAKVKEAAQEFCDEIVSKMASKIKALESKIEALKKR